MEYAIQLLLPVIGGLMLGMWLNRTYGVPAIWTVILAILGMVGGIGVLYKRFAYPQDNQNSGQMAKPTIQPPKKWTKPPKKEGHSAHIKDLDFLYHKYDDKDDWKELDELDDDVSLDEPKPGEWAVPPRKDDTERHDV